MRDALVVEQIQSNKHMQTPLCEAHRARRRRRRKGRLVVDENIQQQYRAFTAKRNRDTPSYFLSLCALKGSRISQKIVGRRCLRRRRATSWLDGTFRCTAFVTNHTLDPLLCRLEVTDIGWWESLRDCCSRRCCCGGRGGKRCHVSCFLRLHATSHFEVRQLK